MTQANDLKHMHGDTENNSYWNASKENYINLLKFDICYKSGGPCFYVILLAVNKVLNTCKFALM